MWTFLAGIAQLFMMLYKEYLSLEAKAKADQKAFVLDQTNLKAMIDSAVSKWNDSNDQRTKEATSAWDAADDDALNQITEDSFKKKI